MAERTASSTALILVDHGSRVEQANLSLLALADSVRESAADAFVAVEAAHMELAEPDLPTAYASCVAAGARKVIVLPYFLVPGRHVNEDIPRLVAQAAAGHPEVGYEIAPALGEQAELATLVARLAVGLVGGRA